VYVDAQIDIDPLVDTNPINQAHTFTITVQQDDGLAAADGGDGVTGWAPAPNGTIVSLSFVTNTIGAVFSPAGVNTCTINNGLGTCQVSINSSSPGSVTLSATTTFSVGGQSLTRTTGTGGNNSDNAVKNYVASRLRIRKLVVPDEGSQAFTFSPTGGWNGGSDFNLTRNTTKDSGLIPPGTYGADETLNSAYVLTNVACVITGTSTAKDFTPTSPSGKSGVSVVLAANEDVTCTFTNSKLPTLTVVKVISGDPTTFDFAIDRDPPDPVKPPDLQLTPTGDGPAGADSDGPNVITVGAHNVKEVNIPGGWLLTDFSCVSDQGGFGEPVKSGSNISFSAGYGDDVTCTFVNDQQGGTTRTQGFWATHTILTNIIWNGGTLPAPNQNVVFTPVIGSPDAKLCTANDITAIVGTGTNQVMGGFWSNIANTSGAGKEKKGAKRSALDKARMQFLQQYLAAVLNVHLFGTPLPSGSSLAGARNVYCNGNAGQINTYMGILAGYYEAGDNGVFTPGANATAQESKRQADIPFWDTTYR
jgi:hypothetical protein